MNAGILKYVFLPREATEVELRHVQRINRVALAACVAHLPLFILVAWLCGTSMRQAIGFGTLLVLGPAVANKTLKNPRTLSLVFGFTSMALGALLVHLGQGPMQIEMHFHFFAALALLTVWGNPSIIWVATITVAVHHGLFWLLLPKSVFNYQASIWVVIVHATFVVVEAVAAAFIARNFFDNVIELEKVVQKKTEALDQRNQDMKRILDNAAQGFMSVAMDGMIRPEHSQVITTWLGEVSGRSAFDVVGGVSEESGRQLRLGWEGLIENFMPMEVIIDQLPKQIVVGSLTLGLEYRPVLEYGKLSSVLVVVSDFTAEIERARAERAQAETMAIFEKINRDRGGFLEFMDEGAKLVAGIADGTLPTQADVWRAVHTLKGASGLFGISSVADLCHAIEDQMAEDAGGVRAASSTMLRGAWAALTERVGPFLGSGSTLSVGERDLLSALSKLEGGASRDEIARMLASWRYEPTAARFHRFAEQSSALALRLGKDPVDVIVDDQGVRLPQKKWAAFWVSFSHAIRNALDHGIEAPDERAAAGKGRAEIRIKSEILTDRLVLSITDNGRGIDWPTVRERCHERGLPQDTAADLVNAVFSDGLSTKTDVSATSGRGVGLGSLKQECVRLGGSVTLESERGRGTCLAFSFPLEAMLDRAVAVRAA